VAIGRRGARSQDSPSRRGIPVATYLQQLLNVHRKVRHSPRHFRRPRPLSSATCGGTKVFACSWMITHCPPARGLLLGSSRRQASYRPGGSPAFLMDDCSDYIRMQGTTISPRQMWCTSTFRHPGGIAQIATISINSSATDVGGLRKLRRTDDRIRSCRRILGFRPIRPS
jgi:hypothetical protein